MSTRNAWATGLAVFAGVLMLTVGVLQVLQGLVALFQDEFFVQGFAYTYEFDVTAWGVIHLILGIILLLVGYFVINGNDWARGAGIGIAALVVIANFMWLPYYPYWSIIVIALGVAIIWALAVYRPERP